MRRILFVDDEQRVLDGLGGALRKMRAEWEMTFVTSGEEALARLGSTPFEVIVSDVRMPGMDGIELLRRVRQEHPDVIRFALSGQTDEVASRRVVDAAQQSLAKPCDVHVLRSALQKALRLRPILVDAGLRERLAEPAGGPWLCRVRQQAIEMAGETAALDDAAAARLLQTVGSALAERFPPGRWSLQARPEHALRCARIARRLAGRTAAKDAFVAGLVHAIGRPVMAAILEDRFDELLAEAAAEDLPLHEVERRGGQAGHARIGAFLLGREGFPCSILEAVAFHHDPPGRPAEGALDAATALYAAHLLLEEAEQRGCEEAGRGAPGRQARQEALASLGPPALVESWRSAAAEADPA